MLSSSADQHLYNSEFQIKGALTVNVFNDNASVIFGTTTNSTATVIYSHCTNRFEHHTLAVFSLGSATVQ